MLRRRLDEIVCSYQNADAIVRLLVCWLLSALAFPIGVLAAMLMS